MESKNPPKKIRKICLEIVPDPRKSNARRTKLKESVKTFPKNVPNIKMFIGFGKTGYLRNCTILSKLLLGNGELASLAYGSLKELHNIESAPP
jgi:hypothetical protein